MTFEPLEIALRNLHFYAHHGVLPQEREVGAHFTLNLWLTVEHAEPAIEEDRLEGTISYADVYELAKEEMGRPSQLLEHVAGRLLHQLFTTYPNLVEATCELSKDNPPTGAKCDGCAVTLTAHR